MKILHAIEFCIYKVQDMKVFYADQKRVSSLSSLPPDHTMIGLGPITPSKPLAEEGTLAK